MIKKPCSIHLGKPWGSFTQYVINTKCTVKIIQCNPGHSLSLQKHSKRDELWIVMDHGAIVELDGKTIEADKDSEIWIPAGCIHRLSCAKNNLYPIRVLEISLGNFNEDDIERLEDAYGRI